MIRLKLDLLVKAAAVTVALCPIAVAGFAGATDATGVTCDVTQNPRLSDTVAGYDADTGSEETRSVTIPLRVLTLGRPT